MPDIKIYSPETLGKPLGPYSQITRVKASEFLFIAGQVATDRAGNLIGPDDFDAQCRQTYANIKTALESAGAAGTGVGAGSHLVHAATEPPKGKIPDTPFKTGHMTFLTSPAAVLGEPSLKGHIMAAEEINAKGGLLGRRKIETITADEAA